MEYLSRLMHNNKKIAKFHFHLRCRKENITHLLFADDLLIFCCADKDSVHSLMSTFKRFSKASGLEANTSKSNIYVFGVDNQRKDNLLQFLQMEEGAFPFRYPWAPSTPKSLILRTIGLWWIKSLEELVSGPP